MVSGGEPRSVSATALADAIVDAEIRGTRDLPALAAAIERVLARLRELVAPLMGDVGFDVVVRRSIERCGHEHAWLGTVIRPARLRGAPSPVALADLATTVEQMGAGPATRAITSLLRAVLDLLGQLVGDDMTERLASSIWALPPGLSPRSRERLT